MPGADPGEGYMAINSQLYGSIATPPSGQVPANQGFVRDFECAAHSQFTGTGLAAYIHGHGGVHHG